MALRLTHHPLTSASRDISAKPLRRDEASAHAYAANYSNLGIDPVEIRSVNREWGSITAVPRRRV